MEIKKDNLYFYFGKHKSEYVKYHITKFFSLRSMITLNIYCYPLMFQFCFWNRHSIIGSSPKAIDDIITFPYWLKDYVFGRRCEFCYERRWRKLANCKGGWRGEQVVHSDCAIEFSKNLEQAMQHKLYEQRKGFLKNFKDFFNYVN